MAEFQTAETLPWCQRTLASLIKACPGPLSSQLTFSWEETIETAGCSGNCWSPSPKLLGLTQLAPVDAAGSALGEGKPSSKNTKREKAVYRLGLLRYHTITGC
jgi:hypothetical protein